jgi:hypothetical protein
MTDTFTEGTEKLLELHTRLLEAEKNFRYAEGKYQETLHEFMDKHLGYKEKEVVLIPELLQRVWKTANGVKKLII